MTRYRSAYPDYDGSVDAWYFQQFRDWIDENPYEANLIKEKTEFGENLINDRSFADIDFVLGDIRDIKLEIYQPVTNLGVTLTQEEKEDVLDFLSEAKRLILEVIEERPRDEY